jgi:hypothetical protein
MYRTSPPCHSRPVPATAPADRVTHSYLAPRGTMRALQLFMVRCTLLSAVLLSTASCGDQLVPLPTEHNRAADSSGAAARNIERQAVADLTRAVAVALNDSPIREDLFESLRQSSVTRDRKLHLQSYLHGNAGFIRRIAELKGQRPQDVISMLSTLRSMELYMPVARHREQWTGSTEIIVALQLNETDIPIGYRLDGSSVQLGLSAPPDIPVLAIVPAETDFSRYLPSDWIGVDDQGGRAVGTLAPQDYLRSSEAVNTGSHLSVASEILSCDPETALVECPEEGGGGGGINWTMPSNAPTGLYMTALELNDYKEPWIKGDPEIEVFVFGPAPNDPPHVARVISCAGEYPASLANQTATFWRKFDQNSYSGFAKVLLLTGEQIESHRFDEAVPDHRRFEVIVIEDDHLSCQLALDNNYYTAKTMDFVAGYTATAAFMGCFLDPVLRIKVGFALP